MAEALRTLGPVTEARFAEVFGKGALATAKDAAALLNIDTDTLSEMTDAGFIRAVRRGTLRSWTEHDLRTYLLEGPDAPARRQEPAPVTVARTAGRRGQVVLFTDLVAPSPRRGKR